MRHFLQVMGVLLCVILVATLGVAQESTGALVGAITDQSGAAVPGASIEVTGTTLGRTIKISSDARGEYLALNLPPGVYAVTATAKGFATSKVENIQLPVGRQLKVDLKLEVSRVAETVVVTSESLLVDTQTAKSAVNLLRQELDAIPKPRTFQNLAALAPGAQLESKNAGIQIDGASGAENIWVIDGVDTTNQQVGTSAKNLVTDWIQELQVKSSGFEAEYGGAMGGVVNVVTKSGTNTIHGELYYYYYGSKLQTDPRPRLRINPVDNKTAEYLKDPKDKSNTTDVGFDIGGPIIKDKLWYFLGYQPVLTNTTRNVFFVVPKFARQYQFNSSTQNWIAKLSYQPLDRLRTNFSVTSGRSKYLGNLPSYDGTENPDGGFERQGNRQPNVGYNADTYLSATSKLFFNFRVGYFFRDLHQVGVPKTIRYSFGGTPTNYTNQLAPEFRQQSGWSNVPTVRSTSKDTYTRVTGSTDANWFTHFLGDHSLKFGYQVNRLSNDARANTSLDDELLIYFDDTWENITVPGTTKGRYGYYVKRFFGTTGSPSSSNHGIFVEDSWQVNRRLRLSLGVRTEREFIPSFRTETGIKGTAIEFPFSDKFSPRLGFAFDVFGNNKSKLYASFGLLYDLMKYELPRGSFGGDVWFDDIYPLDTLDIGSIGHGNYPGRKSETIDWRYPANAPQPDLGGISLIDPKLKPMREREFTVGYDQMLGKDWTINLRYARKRLDRAIEDVGVLVPGVGETYFIANPGEGITLKAYGAGCDVKFGGPDCANFAATPKATRRYDGLEVRAQRRFTKNWQSVFNYTYSRLTGNYSGLASSDESISGTGRASPNVNRYFDLPYLYVDAKGKYIDGPLATDRAHNFKYYGSYRIPLGRHAFTIGGVFFAGSGIPTTREGEVVSSTRMMFENRNSDGRRAAFSLTNLYFAQDFKVSEGATLRFDFNLDNAWDQSTPLNYFYYYTRDRIRSGIAGSAIQKNSDATRGFDYQKEIALRANLNRPATCGSFESDPSCAGARMRLDTRFLKANVFRGPLTGRLGIRFIF